MMSSPFWNNILLSSLRLDAVKANARLEQIVGLEFLVTNIFEVFPAESAAGIAQGTRRKCRRVRFRANYRSNID
jgi:hypothetical protein